METASYYQTINKCNHKFINESTYCAGQQYIFLNAGLVISISNPWKLKDSALYPVACFLLSFHVAGCLNLGPELLVPVRGLSHWDKWCAGVRGRGD